MATCWKALGFDLGDTLVEYEGVPLSWEPQYPEAIARLAKVAGISPTDQQLVAGIAVLRKYNTRLTPREVEVSFADILCDLEKVFNCAWPTAELISATAFFELFRQKLRAFPDAASTLRSLRAQGLRIGVFTDVPYGMPRPLVDEDLRLSGISEEIDVVLTSREAGYRKPARQTLQVLADRLRARPEEMAYVGNERKDIQVALAFGCEAILLARSGVAPVWGQHRTIRSLSELCDLADGSTAR